MAGIWHQAGCCCLLPEGSPCTCMEVQNALTVDSSDDDYDGEYAWDGFEDNVWWCNWRWTLEGVGSIDISYNEGGEGKWMVYFPAFLGGLETDGVACDTETGLLSGGFSIESGGVTATGTLP